MTGSFQVDNQDNPHLRFVVVGLGVVGLGVVVVVWRGGRRIMKGPMNLAVVKQYWSSHLMRLDAAIYPGATQTSLLLGYDQGNMPTR
jgi:hypothetical protein